MGYTHYFEQKSPLSTFQWTRLTADVKKIVEVVQGTIALESNSHDGKMFSNSAININGVDDDAHETFYLPKDEKVFHFCKTARKPYDLVVTAALLLAHHHAPDHYSIGSDGDSKDWVEAMNLNAQMFGYGYILPDSIHGEHDSYEQEAAKLVTTNQSNTEKTNKKSHRFNI